MFVGHRCTIKNMEYNYNEIGIFTIINSIPIF